MRSGSGSRPSGSWPPRTGCASACTRGQYTVLNSPDDDVVRRAVADLAYHAAFLDALGTGAEAKVVLHVGGAYGDKKTALRRFVARCRELDAGVRRRLVAENDDRLFTAEDALAASAACGIPMVFDVLHHRLNHDPGGRGELELLDAAARTWGPQDGPQKGALRAAGAGQEARQPHRHDRP